MIERNPTIQQFIETLFPEAQNIKEGKCPFCGKIIDVDNEFKDDLSRREYEISGMCQTCQDEFFKGDDQ